MRQARSPAGASSSGRPSNGRDLPPSIRVSTLATRSPFPPRRLSIPARSTTGRLAPLSRRDRRPTRGGGVAGESHVKVENDHLAAVESLFYNDPASRRY